MKASRKADLAFIHQKMRDAAHSLHVTAQRIGVAGFIDYANRVTVYVERCKAMLDADEDFTEYEPHNDVLSRLQIAEAQLTETRNQLAQLHDQQNLHTGGDFAARVDAFERIAYQRVEADLRQLDLWVASGGGGLLAHSGDGSLLSSIRALRAAREQVALRPARTPQVQPPALPTDFPQSFEVPDFKPSLTPDPPAEDSDPEDASGEY